MGNLNKMQRRIMVVGIVIAVAVVITFICLGTFSVKLFVTMYKSTIKDTNGPDDYSLVKITRDELINSNECSNEFFGTSKGERSMIGDAELEFYDYDIREYFSGFFETNGVVVIQATKTDKDIVRLNINVVLEKGNAEVAVIVDGEYYCSVEVNKHSEIVIENAQNKTILLKAACESANVTIDVVRSYQ